MRKDAESLPNIDLMNNHEFKLLKMMKDMATSEEDGKYENAEHYEKY